MQRQSGGGRPPQEIKNGAPDNGFRNKAPAQSGTLIGEVIKRRYQMHTLIGKGGMGEVYAAHDIETGKDVAVKIVSRDIIEKDSGKESVKRFIREATTTMTVNNPHVIDMMDVSTFGDRIFCVMELLHGKDLRKLLAAERKPMDFNRMTELVTQICDGVQAAHDRNIMHRDLKPANIFITTTNGKESVKLLDFGIAKFTEAADVSLTTTNTLLGTPPYMAPEQIRKKDYDHRVDIYALGIIVYELATGVVPFNDELPFNILTMHVTKEPMPPRMRRPDLPEHIDKAILKALQKNPDARFQSAKEFADAIANDPAKHKSDPPKRRISDPPPRATAPAYHAVSEKMLQAGESSMGRMLRRVALVAALAAAAGAAYIKRDFLLEKGTALVEEVQKQGVQKKGVTDAPAQAPVESDTYPITVRTTPEGAAVYERMPGSKEETYISKTPLVNHHIKKGEHTLVIKATGCKNRTVTVSEMQSSVNINLSSCKGVRRKAKAQDEEGVQQIEGYDTPPAGEGYEAAPEVNNLDMEQGAVGNE